MSLYSLVGSVGVLGLLGVDGFDGLLGVDGSLGVEGLLGVDGFDGVLGELGVLGVEEEGESESAIGSCFVLVQAHAQIEMPSAIITASTRRAVLPCDRAGSFLVFFSVLVGKSIIFSLRTLLESCFYFFAYSLVSCRPTFPIVMPSVVEASLPY